MDTILDLIWDETFHMLDGDWAGGHLGAPIPGDIAGKAAQAAKDAAAAVLRGWWNAPG